MLLPIFHILIGKGGDIMYAKREIPAPLTEKTTPFPQKSTTTKLQNQPQQTTNFSPLLILLLLDLISIKS